MPNENHAAQKKCLSNTRKQLRVWVENEKYDQFKTAVSKNGESIYSVINQFISSYIQANQPSE